MNILRLRFLLRLSLNIALTIPVLLLTHPSNAQPGVDSTSSKLDQHPIQDPTHLGGYGEMAFHDSSGTGKPRLDIVRFTIDIDHDFSPAWEVESELEMEHVKLEQGMGGEIAIEEAFLEYHNNEQIGWRGGLLLIPIGIVNQTHEPNTFLSVDRPLFDRIVIPTTWREIGTGIFGSLSKGFQYQLYVTEGLHASSISINGLDPAKQEGSAGAATSDAIFGSDASHPAVSAKAVFQPSEGLQIGASGYFQPNAFDSLPSGISGQFLMIMLDGQYAHGPFHLRAEGGMFSVSEGAAALNGIPKQAVGGYVETAYNIFPILFKSNSSELLPFVRYESFTFNQGPFVEGPDLLHVSHSVLTGGLAFKPIENVILKADYSQIGSNSTPQRNLFSLGAGYSY